MTGQDPIHIDYNKALQFQQKLFNKLDKQWKDKGTTGERWRAKKESGIELPYGIDRPGFTMKEQRPIDAIAAYAHHVLGLEVWCDLIGNTYMIKRTKNPTAGTLVTGSHVDAVKNGGRFDGPAGVIAGLTALKMLQDQRIEPAQDVAVVIFRTEESSYYAGQVSLGSKMALGQIGAKALNIKFNKGELSVLDNIKVLEIEGKKDGKSVKHHLDVLELKNKLSAEATLFPVDKTAAFIEAHIEQGPVLSKEKEGTIGIGESIRGNIRYTNNTIVGLKGHSGATPEYMRKDAARAIIAFLSKMEDFRKIYAEHNDLVYTPSQLFSDNPTTTISDLAKCSFEFRSDNNGLLEDARKYVDECTLNTAKEFNGVEIKLAPYNITKASTMDGDVIRHIETEAGKHNLDAKKLPIGAGHDAAAVEQAGIPTGFIAIRQPETNLAYSHLPEEAMDLKSFMNASKTLAQIMADGFTKSGTAVDKSGFVAKLQSEGAIELYKAKTASI